MSLSFKASQDFPQLFWSRARAGEALEALARAGGLTTGSQEVPPMSAAVAPDDRAELARWMDWAAGRLGFEVEAVATPLAGFAELLQGTAPALWHGPPDGGADHGILAVLKSRGKTLWLIAPDLKVHRVNSDALTIWLSAPLQAPYVEAIDHLLDVAQVAPKRRYAARAAMLQEHLGAQPLGDCWLVRASAQTGFVAQVRQAGLPRKVVWMLATFALLYVAEILGWGLVGRITLNGRLDTGWFMAWGLLVLSLVPLHWLGGWLDSGFALDFGRMLKARLLSGILQSDLDTVRRQGAGQLLSRVMESQALESLAINGGMGVLIATLELVIAATVLASGAGGYLHVALLAGWLMMSLVWSLRYFHRLRDWTLLRLGQTHALVERMVGHRTRLAQERSARRDAQEDMAMRDYLEASHAMDRAIVPAAALMPRGWMLVGLLGMLPSFVAGNAGAGSMAVALGGMLLANRALTGISGGLASLSRARIAWIQVASLFRVTETAASKEPFLTAAQLHGGVGQGGTVINASSLAFAYTPDAAKVLDGVNLSIRAGEQILLEGPSGGGKSTLASMLVGLRQPQSGLLLLNGVDRHTLGESWHQMTTQAPQFHENHILVGTLAFNLLMGRNWPASKDELAEAQVICEDLGLGDLLARMPSGLMQMVGETGWQLSHGERSRIFLARALLQKAQLTVLDESFAALDPETLKLCLECARKRSNALLVIAHP
jgi:ATP-binding cassette, subfamily B, bacterial